LFSMVLELEKELAGLRARFEEVREEGTRL
jgi:hypothetical protein